MIELLLLFILVCVGGAVALAVVGATFVYLFGLLLFKLVVLPFKLVWAMGKGAVVVACFVLLVMLKLMGALFAVVLACMLGLTCVWLVARAIGRRGAPAIATSRASGFDRMQERMRYFEGRMLRLEQVLSKSFNMERIR